MGEEHLQKRHMLNAYQCVLCGERIQALKGFNLIENHRACLLSKAGEAAFAIKISKHYSSKPVPNHICMKIS